MELIVWSYYTILLLKASNNYIPLIFIAYGVLHAGGMLGFVLGGIFFNKLGYLNSFRLSNGILLLTALLCFLTLPFILDVALPLMVLRGIGMGLFWNGVHLYNIRELNMEDRSRFIGLLYSLASILTIALPVLAGALITFSGGYEWIFLLGSAIYLVGTIYPWTYNKVPRDTLTVIELRDISNRRGFKRWALSTFAEEVLLNQRVTVLTMLPFLFIGNEFGVGVLGSAIGLMSALVSFIHRNDDLKRKVHFGYIGATIVTACSSLLAIFWGLPLLILRELVSKLGFAFYEPVAANLHYHIKELFLGDFKEQFAIELQEYAEFFLFLGRMFNLLLFTIIFFVFQFDALVVIRVIFAVSIIREFFFFTLNLRIAESLKR